MSSRRHFNRRRFLHASTAAGAALWAATAGLPLRAQDIRHARRSRMVLTQYGRIQGVRYPGDVNAFYGIPYAASTGDEGRFMAPRKPVPWTGIKDTLRVGNRCPQDVTGPLTEVAALDRREPLGEDCLNLNVFTPGLDDSRRPVMVWLHGGGYTSGSGGWLLYDGTNLARSQDVVVVTINHRLNVFGYLHLAGLGGEQYADSGNAGMLDIIAALEWVRGNIAAFGGDPGNVTVFGQSGGAGKVSTLMAMPAAQGLFHKAIAMSGSTIQGITPDRATEVAERYLSALELNANQLGRLRGLSMERLLAAYENTPGLQLGPVTDGNHLPRHPFSPDAPAASAGVPMMASSTEHEVNFIPSTPLDPMDEDTLLERVGELINSGAADARRLVGVYREGRPGADNVELYQIIASDNSFRRDVLTLAEHKARQNAAPVYMYYFRWNAAVRLGRLRAYHCLDIPFAFNNVDECASMTGAGQDRYLLASRLSGAFAAFARSGDPNHPGLPEWPAFDTTRRATMIMDNEVEAVDDPYGEARRALYALT